GFDSFAGLLDANGDGAVMTIAVTQPVTASADQELEIVHDGAAGAFVLTWTTATGVRSSDPIAYDVQAAELEQQLRDLTGLNGLTVSGSGLAQAPWQVVLTGTAGSTPVAVLGAVTDGMLTASRFALTRSDGSAGQVSLQSITTPSGNAGYQLAQDGTAGQYMLGPKGAVGIVLDASADQDRVAGALARLTGGEVTFVAADPVTGAWSFELADTAPGSAPVLVASATGFLPGGGEPATFSATTVTDGVGVNEQQRITHDGTKGSFTLSLNAETTAPIAWDAAAADVKAALELLASIGPDNVAVTSSAAGTYDITFQNSLQGDNLDALTFDATALKLADGSAAALSVQTLVDGDTGHVEEVQQFYHDADWGAFVLTFQGETTAPIAYDASAAQVQTALEGLAPIHPGDIAVAGTGTQNNPWVVTFVNRIQRVIGIQHVPFSNSSEGGDAAADRIVLEGGASADHFTVTQSDPTQVKVVQSGGPTFVLLNAARDAQVADTLRIEGFGGNDTLEVDATEPLTADIIALELSGGADDDTLIGSIFDDLIDGGLGDDTLTGGPGQDAFLDAGGTDTLIERQDADMSLFDDVLLVGEILGDDGSAFFSADGVADENATPGSAYPGETGFTPPVMTP
ncbi:MAG: hypothetical protein KDI64_19365, partial [Candidatus Accumulibacter sp.]|nr:hypothetical protein [Accumulibacter sp.]